MWVVCEVDYLPDLRHLAKEPERLLGPEIIKSLHDVVSDKRNRLPRGDKFVVTGDAQREIELEARALR